MNDTRLAAVATAALMISGAVVAPATDETAEASNQFREVLEALPAGVLDGEGGLVAYVDMNLIWERVGVGTDPAERAAFEPWSSLSYNVGPTPLIGPGSDQADEMRQAVGFDAFDIERALTAGVPPHEIVILDAMVDDETVIDAIHQDPEWSADLQEIDSPAGSYFQWTDDPSAIHPERRSVLRPLGRGGSLALIDADATRVVRTIDPTDIESVLDVVSGTGASVADIPELAAAIDALDGRNVSQGLIWPRPTLLDFTSLVLGSPTFDSTSPEDQLETLREQALPVNPYLGVVLVEVVDGDSVHTEILVIHPDADTAAANVEPISRHVSEAHLTTGESAAEVFAAAEVQADGAMVRITVPGDEAFARVVRLLYTRSLLPV